MNDTKNMQGPIFVVGVPRSGTTVFSLKLASAAGIAMAPETHFMPEVYRHLKKLDLTQDASVETVLASFEKGRWFADLNLTVEAIKQEFIKCETRNWPKLFDTILQLYAVHHGANFYGEKTPGHYRYVKLLLEWFPQCRIIFMVRDPRAIVSSNMNAPFSPSYAWFVARRWDEMWSIYATVAEDPRVTCVRYRDFVSNTEACLSDLKDWLGVERAGRTQVSDGDWVQGDTQLGWRAQHLKEASGSINSKGLDKWKKKLSPYQIWVTDNMAGIGPAELGYAKVKNTRYSFLYRLLFTVQYPYERILLSIEAAMRPLTEHSRKRTLKTKALVQLGRWIDTVQYCAFRVFGTRKNKAPYRIVLSLKDMHIQESFFLPLTSSSELIGIVAMGLSDRQGIVDLEVCCRRQFMAARKIVHGFGLRGQVGLSYNKSRKSETGVQIKAFAPRNSQPVYVLDDFVVTPTNVREKTAHIIDEIETAMQLGIKV